MSLTWVPLCSLFLPSIIYPHCEKDPVPLQAEHTQHSELCHMLQSFNHLSGCWLTSSSEYIYIYLALESPKMDTASRCVTPVVSRGERSPFFDLPSALCLMQLRRQLSSWSVPSQYCSILHFVLQTFMVFLCSCLSISSACRSLSEWVLSNLLGYKPLLTLSLVFLISMKYHNVTAIQYFLKSQKINWNCG